MFINKLDKKAKIKLLLFSIFSISILILLACNVAAQKTGSADDDPTPSPTPSDPCKGIDPIPKDGCNECTEEPGVKEGTDGKPCETCIAKDNPITCESVCSGDSIQKRKCDPKTGGCVNDGPPTSCDDGNDCTADTCKIGSKGAYCEHKGKCFRRCNACTCEGIGSGKVMCPPRGCKVGTYCNTESSCCKPPNSKCARLDPKLCCTEDSGSICKDKCCASNQNCVDEKTGLCCTEPHGPKCGNRCCSEVENCAWQSGTRGKCCKGNDVCCRGVFGDMWCEGAYPCRGPWDKPCSEGSKSALEESTAKDTEVLEIYNEYEEGCVAEYNLQSIKIFGDGVLVHDSFYSVDNIRYQVNNDQSVTVIGSFEIDLGGVMSQITEENGLDIESCGSFKIAERII